MESAKGSSPYLPPKMHKQTIKFPLGRGRSAWTSCPFRCKSRTSKAGLPTLVVALFLFSMGMLMCNTNCAVALLTIVHDQSSHGRYSQHSNAVTRVLAAELQLHRRLRGMSHHPMSIPPAAAAQGVGFQPGAVAEEEVDRDQAASPRKLEVLPKDGVQGGQLSPGRDLVQQERMEATSRWPNLGFQQKMHEVPDGPDPIHNR